MEVKEAIAKAKAYVMDVYADASIADLELEETESDQKTGQWRIALSFALPKPPASPSNSVIFKQLEILGSLQNGRKKRVHKIIVITNAGEVVAMKDRAWMESAE